MTHPLQTKRSERHYVFLFSLRTHTLIKSRSLPHTPLASFSSLFVHTPIKINVFRYRAFSLADKSRSSVIVYGKRLLTGKTMNERKQENRKAPFRYLKRNSSNLCLVLHWV